MSITSKLASIEELTGALRDFAADRDWDQFHTPKNLLMALTGEVGELVEIFQWLNPEEAKSIMADASKATHIREEVADVFIYLVRLSDRLGIDLLAAAEEKMAKNALKYPANKLDRTTSHQAAR